MVKRAKGAVKGIVQGVGFRPFLYQLAHRFELSGYVNNTSQGVDVEVQGREEDIEGFFSSLVNEAPRLARIASLEWDSIPLKNEKSFEIRQSEGMHEKTTLISPDVCICPDCLSEMLDSNDRRYRYPFINCTNCGPRYTIIKDIPYDRDFTTMKPFEMCPECRREYNDPNNRRFHAQPNACWSCGPTVFLCRANGQFLNSKDPVEDTIALLSQGFIIAIKGLGGYHLAVDAANHQAVIRLRSRKHREEKPLALMVKDLDSAREIAFIDEVEARLLCSYERPIVVVKKRRGHGLSSQIAPKNKNFGIMLPYTPLHHLILEGPFRALVMTSGNRSEEPINISNEGAMKNLGHIADYFLHHNREIYLRSDDSILTVADNLPRQIRRSRGYVPVPVFLSETLKDLPPVLAVGGELKNTICLTKENRAFLSQHIGDMENFETLDFFHLTVAHLKRILEISPEVIAHDLHPDYLTTKFALEQEELPTVPIQHHHAHIVSCIAEHGIMPPVIGLALDGTGLGTDGRIWGGEVLLADLGSFKRLGHLKYLPLPGGDAAIRHPWRTALAYLDKAYGDELFALSIPFMRNLDRKAAEVILQMSRKGLNSPLTSSCGRLFDAVSSLLGLTHTVSYEGQAAIELDMSQNRAERGLYSWSIEKEEGGCRVINTLDVLRGVVEDITKGLTRGRISARFHKTLVDIFSRLCIDLSDETGIRRVALSGGAFQNLTLLEGIIGKLVAEGLEVYSHSIVPANDGGLCLGQAVIAGVKHAGEEDKYADSWTG